MSIRVLNMIGPLVAGSLLALPAPPSAAADQLAIPGDAALSLTGAGRVAAAGDVNGDGSADFLVSKGDQITEPTEGITYVVFGAPAPGKVRLEDLSDGGFAIYGASEGDEASYAAAAGDINGDGLDDVIVGAPGAEVLATGVEPADENYRANAGRAYVIFGKRTTEPVHLADFDNGVQGLQGYRIDGALGRDLAGSAVAGMGDVNGDGRDDVAVAAPFAGGVYVVFGKPTPDPVDLQPFDMGAQGPLGFKIRTVVPEVDDLLSVAGGGDVNGDGLSDVMVGVLRNIYVPGSAYLVFGKADPSSVDTRELEESEGFRMRSRTPHASTGYSVAGVGDMNGDGLSDVAVGAPSLPGNRRAHVYVVFGKMTGTTVQLERLGAGGFTIVAERRYASTGRSIHGGQDVNGDEVPDLVVGAPARRSRGASLAGSAFVVFGRASSRPVHLRAMATRDGYRIDGTHPGGQVGRSVALLGDLNGDGAGEVAVAAPKVGAGYKDGRYTKIENGKYTQPQKAYVLWGRRQ